MRFRASSRTVVERCSSRSRTSGLGLLIGLALAASNPLSAAAEDTVFNYGVDRFEISGNEPGFFFDEFDDDVVDWAISHGTVEEADGYLVLKSPGAHSYQPSISNIIHDRSLAFALPPNQFFVSKGAGDFEALSFWDPSRLAQLPGGYLLMALFAPLINPNDPNITPIDDPNLPPLLEGESYFFDGITIAMLNFSEELASADDFGLLPGPTMIVSTTLTNCCDVEGRILEQAVPGVVPIDPNAISGSLVLRIKYTDIPLDLLHDIFGSDGNVEVAYSLDGGASFETPFDLLPIRLSVGGTFALAGDPASVAPSGSDIPTLPPWGVVTLGALLLGISGWMLRRRLGERS